MPMENISLELKLSLPCLLIGSALFLISFAEPHWLKIDVPLATAYMGLWKRCGGTAEFPEMEICSKCGSDQSGWLTGVQVLECICLSAMVAAVALTFRLLFKQEKMFSLLASAAGISSGLLGLTGAIVFASEESEDGSLGWAFYLNIVGDLLIGAGGGVLMVHAHRV
ncbi:hypothetical protein BaRGS_00004124 [Batillaria attramentaria]|uniref:Transmembrane protein n=1 Tax=Batillaria attramentaria TaxID=370345 RepID=A0ABD0LYW0_9CAEN